MDRQFYESMLQKGPLDFGETEAFWDARAEEFNKNQQKESSRITGDVISLLNQKGILKNASVLDVGGGSGRYAVPFAEYAGHVTIADISGNMLKQAKENAQREGLNNLDYKKMEWSNTDIPSIGWEKKFDLVFASMCPAVRSVKGLANMIAASKGFCLLNQFVRSSDTVSEYLSDKLSIPKGHNPHNDRDSVQSFFNLLWMDGYEPEINYVHACDEKELGFEEVVLYYSKLFKGTADKAEKEIGALLRNLVHEDKIKVKKEKTVAIILWKA